METVAPGPAPHSAKGWPAMTGGTTKSQAGGFNAAKHNAMKTRAAELRAEGKAGAKKAQGLQAVRDDIEKMDSEDLARNACLRERRRRGHLLFQEFGQMQRPLLDHRIPGCCATG